MGTTKLNVLLAKTDHLSSSWKKLLEDYSKFFKTNQGAFKGERKTYQPKPGMIDVPSERSNKLVVTTVKEKLEYLEETSKDYIDSLFSQEKTNSSGIAKAELIVDGKSFGILTSLELLKLKSTLESGLLSGVYESIPVRNDDEEWSESGNEMYKGREVFESELARGLKKSTVKEHYILTDPNLDKVKDGSYSPQVAVRDTIIDLGDYTYQKFSGEWSHRLRAELLRRKTTLLTAVIEALKIANDVEAVKSDITSEKIFNYLHRGK